MNARPLCLRSSKLGERCRVTEGDGVIIIPTPTIAILEVVNKFQTEDEMRGLSYHTNENWVAANLFLVRQNVNS